MRKGGSYVAGSDASEEEPSDITPAPDPQQTPSPPASGSPTEPPKGGFFSSGKKPAADQE